MVRTFQLTKSLERLSVLENVMLGATDQRGERFFASLLRPLWSAQEAEVRERAEELLVRFKLDHMRDEFAGSLSGGQRKLLEMARALDGAAGDGHARRADGRREPRPHPVAAAGT